MNESSEKQVQEMENTLEVAYGILNIKFKIKC